MVGYSGSALPNITMQAAGNKAVVTGAVKDTQRAIRLQELL